MFAVPGWNLSAPLKTQTTQENSKAQTTKHGQDEAADKSAKRKRKDGGGQKVNKRNLAEMWEKVIEGKELSQKPEKKRRKEHTSQDTARTNGQDEQTTAPDGTGAPDSEVKASNLTEDSVKATKKAKKSKQKHDPSIAPQLAGSTHNPAKSTASALPPQPPPTQASTLTPLQASMRAKLTSARFRHLNETLYTQPSSHAAQLFAENPDMFDAYHAGFRQQVGAWPENPVDGYVRVVLARGAVRGGAKIREKKERAMGKRRGRDGEGVRRREEHEGMARLQPLPRARDGTATIADMGCGDARLARELRLHESRLQLRVLSFDLQADGEGLVTKADIADLPVAGGSVDVSVLCLALMGTNWPDFVDEAWRVLRWGGELWVSEIKSRFGRVQRPKDKVTEKKGSKGKKRKGMDEEEGNNEEDAERMLAVEVDGVEVPKQDTDVSPFIEVLQRRGFALLGEPDLSNKMFVRLSFVKSAPANNGRNVQANSEEAPAEKGGKGWKQLKKRFLEEADEEVDEAKVLKPCVYKLR